MSLRRDLEQLAEIAARVNAFHNDVDLAGLTFMNRVELSMAGHPKAASWESGPRSDPAFCWTHGRDVSVCHRNNLACMGDPMSGPSDPTGSAAIQADAAADDERTYRDCVTKALRLMETAYDIQSRFPPTRKPNAYERQQTADPNAPHCESCARHEVSKGVPWWQDIHPNLKNRTTVKDRLKEPMYLCKFCWEHVAERGCLPNPEELEFREKYQGTRDRKVPCPHPVLKNEAAA